LEVFPPPLKETIKGANGQEEFAYGSQERGLACAEPEEKHIVVKGKERRLKKKKKLGKYEKRKR